MIAGHSPRMIFSHQKHLVNPKFPKYMLFTRINSFIALKFNIPVLSPQPVSTTGTTQLTTQPVFSLQASCHSCPFAGLAFIKRSNSESFEGANATASVHKHAKVTTSIMSNLYKSVGDGLHGGADGSESESLMTVDVKTDILDGDAKGQVTTTSCEGPINQVMTDSSPSASLTSMSSLLDLFNLSDSVPSPLQVHMSTGTCYTHCYFPCIQSILNINLTCFSSHYLLIILCFF